MQLVSSKRLSRVVGVIGYFTINVLENFSKGRELFYSAVELAPAEPQKHINLVNLLTVMERYDEAEQRLRVFMSTDTHGGSEIDYRKLKTEIDAARESKASSATEDTRIND